MNDKTTTSPQDTAWPDRALTENQKLVRQSAELIPVKRAGAEIENFAQLVDYANWMSKARAAVPDHLLANVGACLAVIEIANKFNYPAYMVARQTYVVKGMLTFMGQFIMAVINDFCPLRERLKFRFEGEGASLKVFVTGHFKSEVEPVTYESPTVGEITVKNSPLWAVDPRQQMRYLAAKRWQSAYWPEGLFGIYSPDDITDAEPLRHVGAENAKDITAGAALHERLKNAPKSGEGFSHDAVTNGLNSDRTVADEQHGNAAPQEATGEPEASEATTEGATAEKAPRKSGGRPKGSKNKPAEAKTEQPQAEPAAEGTETAPKDHAETTPAEKKPAETPPPGPRNTSDYIRHAQDYIAAATVAADLEAKWRSEKQLRTDCSVSGEDFDQIYNAFKAKVTTLKSA